MSYQTTRYVLLSTDHADGFTIEGVFTDRAAAYAYLTELSASLRPETFEVEGWRGRTFIGTWDHTGQLIEDRNGRTMNEGDTK